MQRPIRFDPSRPFSRQQALEAGLSPADLRTVRFKTVFTGVYLAAEVVVTPELRAEAALVPFPEGAFVSHASAARMLRLPIPTLPDEHVTVSEQRHRRRRRGITCHLRPERPDLRSVGAVPVSGYEQVFVELASQLGLVDLVVVGDHLVRRGHSTIARLQCFCDATTSAAARSAAKYVRGRVDSAMETRLRMLLVLAGLPEPRVNHEVSAADGTLLRRYDLCWPEAGLIAEYDGRHHAESPRQWERDLARREEIDDDGWRIVVVTSAGIYRHPDRTLAKLHRLLRDRGARGVPARLRDDWRPYFPIAG